MVGLFFLSFFALRNFEFPAKIKKGGERPTGPPSNGDGETANEWGDKKESKGVGVSLGLKRPPLAEPMQQPAENSTGDGAT